MKPLSELNRPWKILITLFLVVLSSGFLAAELYLKLTTEMTDGKEGLSLDDITIMFHGNGVPRLKRKIQPGGSMRRFFNSTGVTEDLTPDEIKDIDRVIAWIDKGAPESEYAIEGAHMRAPRLKRKIEPGGSMRRYFNTNGALEDLKPEEIDDANRVIAWVDNGAPESEYTIADEKRKKEGIGRILDSRGCVDCHQRDSTMRRNMHDYPLESFADLAPYIVPEKPKTEGIGPILEKHGCTDCHSRNSTMRQNMHDYPLQSFADVAPYTSAVSAGMDKGRLMSLSHIHLLGMGMMFVLVGMAVASTLWPVWLRVALIVAGHGSIVVDIFGWWGVRQYGAPLAWVVMFGGALMGVSFAGSVAAALYDLWIRKPKVEAESV